MSKKISSFSVEKLEEILHRLQKEKQDNSKYAEQLRFQLEKRKNSHEKERQV